MQSKVSAESIPLFLSGGGEMGQRIREFDWASTSIGGIETWPQSLRTCIRIMLTSRQPIWIGWGKELIKFYNDPYKSIVGGKHPHALGKPASVVWKDIWTDIEPLLKQVMEDNEGNYSESQLLIMERNGYPEETYYTFSYTPVPGDDGKPEGMFCANTEDTDRIISERQLKTLTQLGKSLTDCRSVEDAINRTIATLQDNPYDFPFAIFRTLKDNKAIIAKSTPLGDAAQIVPVQVDLDGNHPISQTLRRALDAQRSEVYENVRENIGEMPKGAWPIPPDKVLVTPIMQTGAKEPFGMLTTGLNPYRLLDEKYAGFLDLVADQVATSIADVNVLEEERKRAAALAEIDRAKTTFFSNISHEFRTPLTLMVGPIEDALNDPANVVENRIRLDIAQRNVYRLLKLVNTLLDFSRIEAGRMQAQFRPVNLSQLTKDLTSTFRSAIEKAGMILLVEADNDIEAYVDIDMWDKIVLNLLSNAFKYTHSGTITVELKKKTNAICFSVSDTGVGIPEEELYKVFDRFHRIQMTGGRSQEGTGIGLSLVQELVKLHHGTIGVKSKIGVGTTFTINLLPGKDHLPFEQIINHQSDPPALSSRPDTFLQEMFKWLPAGDQEGAAVNALDEEGYSIKDGNKRKVLVADDNADMRDYVTRLLQSHFRVTAVPNGKVALEKALATHFDLIISDVMMPELDGFELVRRLKSNQATHNTPVILLSARAGEEATIEGLETGADDYLVKPFSARELLSRAESNIKISESRNRAFQQMYKLFMDAPVAIAILRGKDHRYELANAAYAEISGKENIVGKTLHELFPELRTAGIKELLDNVYETGEPYVGNEFEVELVRRGKKEKVYFNFVYSPFEETEGVVSGVMVVAIDVTQMVVTRKLLEENEERLENEVRQRTEDLQKINDELQRSNKELEQFAFVTSHDLQEPLRKIQTFANLVFERNKHVLDDKSVFHYEKIILAAKRMSSLITDVLRFSRLAKSEEFKAVDLNNILKSVEADFELTIQQEKAQIKSDRLPVIEAVPLQMNQLFSNLLGNALKFHARERRPYIEIRNEKMRDGEAEELGLAGGDTEYCKIVFSDNGIGFPNSYSEKIFEIFQRLHARDSYEGTGIGLALCGRIVSTHKGRIYADGEEGKGSNFYIVLPLKQQASV